MAQQMTEDLRYPVGDFDRSIEVTPGLRATYIEQIGELPTALRNAVKDLSDAQLDTEYRPGGWTVRQVVHHLPDSHINAYIRFKWALTEDTPTIKPYFEERWAELPDSAAPIENSLIMLESLHKRWVSLLKSMTESQFAMSLKHPDTGLWSLGKFLALYSWHGRHHIAHITSLADREGWYSWADES